MIDVHKRCFNLKNSKLGDRVATEFTKLVFKDKKLFAQRPPEGTKPKYMIFFSSEPCKQT